MISGVKVIGAGLAGCEAAWHLANKGIHVELFDMKPVKMSPAHHSNSFAELVCSNSFRASSITNAVGLLKEEMRRLGSIIMKAADENEIAAGGALAVDRDKFSSVVTDCIKSHPNIKIRTQEVTDIPDGFIIVATGPLTSDALADNISRLFPEENMLSFFDAAAPIITFDSIDMKYAFFASRYGKGSADYINCPMNEQQYKLFRNELLTAKTADVHDFEKKTFFEGCMPIEVMAKRGEETMRYGPLKPVGLQNPETGERYYAVVQLRRDNTDGTLYNIVGFQTHLSFSEQKRVFSMIPALKSAEFMRYGVMHRNTYINSPKLLDRYNRFLREPRIRFAGQITGVEGYVESASGGLLTGLETANELLDKAPVNFPKTTAIGALALYTSSGSVSDFQPMNVNFGIIEPLGIQIKGKQNRNSAIAERSLKWIDSYVTNSAYKN